MTLEIRGTAELRHWLVDYLVTTIGCSPETVDLDLSLNELGVGSRDAVVLSGELSELLGRPVSPVEFWQHPTVNALAAFLTAPVQNGQAPDVATTGRDPGASDAPIAVIGVGCRFPGDVDGRNHYPDDIEATIQEITGGRVAAISIPDERTEQLVAIIELKKRGNSQQDVIHRLNTVKREVTSAISQSHSVRISDLVLVPPGSIPITTSGKVRRAACAERYRLDDFNRLDVHL